MTDMSNRSLDANNGIALYTDGSAYYKDRTGGWAWVAIDLDGTMEHDSGRRDGVTINQMELYAPTQGLSTLHQRYGATDVIVFSDSEYVVLGCNDRSRKRVKNREWWRELDNAIGKHRAVEFEHVRGHSGEFYNEFADKLASQARKERKDT